MGARPGTRNPTATVSAADARRAAPGNTACLRGSRLSDVTAVGEATAAGPGRRRRPRRAAPGTGGGLCHADLHAPCERAILDKRGPMIWYPARVLLRSASSPDSSSAAPTGAPPRSVTWQRAPPSSPACDGRGYRRQPTVRWSKLIAGRVAGVRVTRAPGGGISIQIRGQSSFSLSNEPCSWSTASRSRRVRRDTELAQPARRRVH